MARPVCDRSLKSFQHRCVPGRGGRVEGRQPARRRSRPGGRVAARTQGRRGRPEPPGALPTAPVTALAARLRSLAPRRPAAATRRVRHRLAQPGAAGANRPRHGAVGPVRRRAHGRLEHHRRRRQAHAPPLRKRRQDRACRRQARVAPAAGPVCTRAPLAGKPGPRQALVLAGRGKLFHRLRRKLTPADLQGRGRHTESRDELSMNR